jgi:hypothetical protein
MCHITDKTPVCAFLFKKKLSIEIVDFHWFSNILLMKKNNEYELIDDFFEATF